MDEISSVFDPSRLAAVRASALDELEAQCVTFARTAGEPVERAAQAELAEEVRNLRLRWQRRGLIVLESEAQPVTAAKAA
jgi:hypothetical protein